MNNAGGNGKAPLLAARGLKKHFPVGSRLFRHEPALLRAVDGVSLFVGSGETLGLVGESGCGKTTLGRTLIRLLDPTAGSLRFNGEDVTRMSGEPLRRLRRQMQMIFQDPYASLNPKMRVGATLEEGLRVHGMGTKRERRERVAALVNVVGLPPGATAKYPHEFSGGQRQRIGIARALSLTPKLVVADEPVSSLDVSIQAQIINLLSRLQETFGLTYVFISHDLRVVEHISDRVAVMYLGRIVEEAPCPSLYAEPLHPYTQALLSAIPSTEPKQKNRRVSITGDVPSPLSPPSGCAFHPRCPFRMEICPREYPVPRQSGSNRTVACHLYEASQP